MKIETLKERIEKASQKVEKKTGTIEKKTKMIEKKINILKEKYGIEYSGEKHTGNHEVYWIECDIGHLHEDVERIKSEIEETKEMIVKYEKQLSGEIERENIFLKEIPESMKELQNELVKTWDEWDIKRRNRIKQAYVEMDYKTFSKMFNCYERYTFMYMSDEQIHNSNVQEAKLEILALYNRIKDITGTVNDWNGIECEVGNLGLVLTGIVYGKAGTAKVETVLAGGYNIQRLHIRTLVHEI